MAAAVAERTSRVQVGPVQTTPYLNEPMEAATFVATLDELSGGRAVLGLRAARGRDGRVARLRCLRPRRADPRVGRDGTAPAPRRAAARRVVPALRAAPARPADLRDAVRRDLLELSGEIGDGSLPLVMPPAAAAGVVEAIHGAVGPAVIRRTWTSPPACGSPWPPTATRPQRHCARSSRTSPRTSSTSSRADRPPARGPRARSPSRGCGDSDRGSRRHRRDAAARIVGTPADAVAAIGRLADAGVTQVCIGGPLGPDPGAAVRLIGERVIRLSGERCKAGARRRPRTPPAASLGAGRVVAALLWTAGGVEDAHDPHHARPGVLDAVDASGREVEARPACSGTCSPAMCATPCPSTI